MDTAALLDPEPWAEQTFGQAQLGDRRRTRRAVTAAGAMVRDPAASLPPQQHTWKAVKALYRLLNAPDVTDVPFEALLRLHWQQTRAALAGNTTVLLVQDPTELDLSPHTAMSHDGPGTDGHWRGARCAAAVCCCKRCGRCSPRPAPSWAVWRTSPLSVSALPPTSGALNAASALSVKPTAGCAWWSRWGRPPPQAAWYRWVSVAPIGAPCFGRVASPRHTSWSEPRRIAAQNRRVDANEEAIAQLREWVRAWPRQAQRPGDVPATHGRPPRQTVLQLGFGPVTVLPPWNDPPGSHEPLPVWAVRVWETAPPAGEEALEGLLLTALETSLHLQL
jgi:hypothetical protein